MIQFFSLLGTLLWWKQTIVAIFMKVRSMLEFERINNVLLTGMSEVGDVLLIRQTLSTLLQVEIRVNGYLLDLITIKPQILKVYPLVGIANNALIIVREVNEGLDMTLECNRTFRDFDFFRKLKQKFKKEK